MTLQFALSEKVFNKRLRNNRTIVREGTDYPSKRSPVGVMISG